MEEIQKHLQDYGKQRRWLRIENQQACPKVATGWRYKDAPITWRYKVSPKLGVQVRVVAESQSTSSWSRSPIAG